jgi:hypothetical protein
MKRITSVVGVLAMLVLPGIAYASSSTCQQYSTLCSTVTTNNNTTTSTSPTTSTSTSPTTSTSATSTPSVSPTTATNTAVPVATTTTTPGTAAKLPFTGLDVVLLVIGGGALLSAGFVVRRVSRRLN